MTKEIYLQPQVKDPNILERVESYVASGLKIIGAITVLYIIYEWGATTPVGSNEVALLNRNIGLINHLPFFSSIHNLARGVHSSVSAFWSLKNHAIALTWTLVSLNFYRAFRR